MWDTAYIYNNGTVDPAGGIDGITNQDENKPVFYKDHWDKNNQFTSTKEQTITINLDSKNKNGIYIYCDATKNDTPSGKQTFVIKSITFKK